MQVKRFVAGAVCPSCKALDKIQLHRASTYQTIECIKCGFKQKQDFNAVLQQISKEPL